MGLPSAQMTNETVLVVRSRCAHARKTLFDIPHPLQVQDEQYLLGLARKAPQENSSYRCRALRIADATVSGVGTEAEAEAEADGGLEHSAGGACEWMRYLE